MEPVAYLIAGTYRGVKYLQVAPLDDIIEKNNVQFESARFVEYLNGHVWVSHPYKGIFKIPLATIQKKDTAVFHLDASAGILSANNNYLFKIHNRIIAATPEGIFQFDSMANKFVSYPELNKLLLFQNIRYIKEDPYGNLWVIFEKSLIVLDFEGDTPKTITIPEFTNNLLSGFESIYFFNASNVILGAEKGFFLFDYEKYKSSTPKISPQIRRVRLIGFSEEKELFGGFLTQKNAAVLPEIAPLWRTIHIDFSAPAYGQQHVVEYSVMLEGYDNSWSAWSRRTEKEYTNLPPGNFTFLVKVRDHLGNVSEAANYRFKVLPPWYRTKIAYSIYLILFAGLIYLLHRWQQSSLVAAQKRHDEAQAQLKYKQQLALEKQEKEIIKLRNEKLEAELELQNADLAQATLHLVQKAEILNDLKEELLTLTKKYNGAISVSELKRMIKTLGEDDAIESGWDQFTQHFDKVHSNFLTQLKQRFPDLTPGEMKLAGYLRINLSSKEIAQLMHITIKSVELNRYRLRKKLGLSREESLYDFLIANTKQLSNEKTLQG